VIASCSTVSRLLPQRDRAVRQAHAARIEADGRGPVAIVRPRLHQVNPARSARADGEPAPRSSRPPARCTALAQAVWYRLTCTSGSAGERYPVPRPSIELAGLMMCGPRAPASMGRCTAEAKTARHANVDAERPRGRPPPIVRSFRAGRELALMFMSTNSASESRELVDLDDDGFHQDRLGRTVGSGTPTAAGGGRRWRTSRPGIFTAGERGAAGRRGGRRKGAMANQARPSKEPGRDSRPADPGREAQ